MTFNTVNIEALDHSHFPLYLSHMIQLYGFSFLKVQFSGLIVFMLIYPVLMSILFKADTDLTKVVCSDSLL